MISPKSAEQILEEFSLCCKAPCDFVSDDEGTSFYRCTKCCRVIDPISHSTIKKDHLETESLASNLAGLTKKDLMKHARLAEKEILEWRRFKKIINDELTRRDKKK